MGWGAYGTPLLSEAEDKYVLFSPPQGAGRVLRNIMRRSCELTSELTSDGAGGARTHESSAALNGLKYVKICPRLYGCTAPRYVHLSHPTEVSSPWQAEQDSVYRFSGRTYTISPPGPQFHCEGGIAILKIVVSLVLARETLFPRTGTLSCSSYWGEKVKTLSGVVGHVTTWPELA